MKVIQTFVKMIKRNISDRQIVLVITARALKYLEDCGQRQSQLFTVLEKYHQVPNSLEDLKSQFNFLKEATFRNIENLQQTINVQQTYTTNLCGHINVILSRITKLQADIQKFTKNFTTEQDTVQIDAPDFDPDINGPDTQWVHHTAAIVSVHELFTSTEPESLDASNTLDKTADRDQLDTKHSSSEDSHRPCNFPKQISVHLPEDNFTAQQQVASTDNNVSDEIPQLEEDWENSQFPDADTNLINRHNTHSEIERIQKEYIEHLLDLKNNQYYLEEYPSNQLQYSIPDPECYGPPPRKSHTQPCDPAGYYHPAPDPAEVQHWHTCGRGKNTYLHRQRLFGEKTCSSESRKARKGQQNFKQ